MSAGGRRLTRCCGNPGRAGTPKTRGTRWRQAPSLFGRLFAQLLQEVGKLALGRLLEFVENGLFAFRSLEVSRVAICHHQAVVRGFVARLEFDSPIQE